MVVLVLSLAQTSAATDTKVPAQGGAYLKNCAQTNYCDDYGSPFDFKCGEGSYVNSFDVTYNNAITSLGPFACTKVGTDTVTVDKHAGDLTVGKQNTLRSPSAAGFRGVAMRTGDLIDMIGGVGPTREITALVGGDGGGDTLFVECPGTDYKVTGFHGAATLDNVITVGVYCGMFGKADEVKPQP